jgi:hypothetical protein
MENMNHELEKALLHGRPLLALFPEPRVNSVVPGNGNNFDSGNGTMLFVGESQSYRIDNQPLVLSFHCGDFRVLL